MGLSSSQARLLTLTGRMHDIEFKAARLEAQKLQMANESRRVYEDYLNAIDKSKVQIATLNTDGSLNYIDTNYSNLIKSGYKISASSEYFPLKQSDIDEFYSSEYNGNIEKYAAVKSGMAIKNDAGEYVLATDNTKYLVFENTEFDKYVKSNNDVILMSDITLDTSNGYIAEEYSGKIDGNNHTMSISGKDGLFRYLKDGACITNIKFNADITNDEKLLKGIISRTSEGNVYVENIELSGQISSVYHVSGLIGNNKGTCNIKNVKFNDFQLANTDDNNSNTNYYLGGLVALQKGDLNVSDVSGSISVDGGYYIGGILGSEGRFMSGSSDQNTKSNIQNINFNVSIISTNCDSAGGIVGLSYSPDTVIKNCYVTGSIDADNYENSNYDTYAAGIIGIIRGGKIENCYSDVVITSDVACPIVGTTRYDSSVQNDANTKYDLILTNNAGLCSDGNIHTDKVSMSCADTSISNYIFSQTQSAGDIKNSAMSYSSENIIRDIPSDFVPTAEYEYYKTVGEKIVNEQYFVIDGHEEENEWISNMLTEGLMLLAKKDSKGNYYDTSISVETDLQEVPDKNVLKKAEAKYEADMKRIDLKDRKFDTDLAALDSERNAIKQEIETLKTIAKDNVERTFRLFS